MRFSFYNSLLVILLLLIDSNAYALTAGYKPLAGDYIFYTFAVCGVVFSGLVILAYKEYQWLWYVVLSLLLVIHASAIDGTLAYFIDSQTDIGNDDFVVWVVPFLLTTSIACYGFLVAAIQINTPHFLQRVKPTFVFLSVISAILTVSTVFWLGKFPLSHMWLPANILFFSMVVSQFLPPLTWTSYSPRLRLLIRIYPFVVSAVTVGGYGYLSMTPTSNHIDFNHLYRLILLLVAFFSLTIVIWQAFNNKQTKELAERKAIEAAKNKAEMQLALIESEKAYQQALDAAARHRNQLASVSHDLKQPLSALRMAAEQLANQHPADAEKLNLAVDYIDSLSHSYKDEHTRQSESSPENEFEVVSTAMLIAALQKMFESDAQQKQIKIRFYSPNYRVVIDPLSTMRIMTNVISNAIKHAQASRVVVGFRQKENMLIFQVHDNGLGISGERQSELFNVGTKGGGSQGDGLGLAIVKELCDAQKMMFELRSTQGVGTSVYIAMNKVED